MPTTQAREPVLRYCPLTNIRVPKTGRATGRCEFFFKNLSPDLRVLDSSQMTLELRLAIRNLLRNPRFAAAAVVILALGSAATTAIFSIAHGILLRDLPYDQPDRLVSIGARFPKAGFVKANAG